jgi:hypothetical protein
MDSGGVVNFILMLLLLLAACVIAGAIRKLRGGTLLPEPAPGESHMIYEKKRGRWWRYDPETNTLEDAFRRPQKRI